MEMHKCPLCDRSCKSWASLGSHFRVHKQGKISEHPSYQRKKQTLDKELAREEAEDRSDYRCAFCRSPYDVIMHHRDGNPKNNGSDNLLLLCHRCHGLLHKPPLSALPQKVRIKNEERVKKLVVDEFYLSDEEREELRKIQRGYVPISDRELKEAIERLPVV